MHNTELVLEEESSNLLDEVIENPNKETLRKALRNNKTIEGNFQQAKEIMNRIISSRISN